jgi:RNA-binding protein
VRLVAGASALRVKSSMPALSLSPAERSALRSQAHALKPVVLIGAEGLTDAVLAEIKVHLDAHQLIKIRVFGDERDARIAIYDEVCDRLNAAPIQHIGKLLVIWRPEQAAAPAPSRGRRSAPSAREIALRGEPEQPGKGRAPRVVKVVKQTQDKPLRKPKAQKVLVRGNERVTAGGNVKRAKKRQASTKRPFQNDK